MESLITFYDDDRRDCFLVVRSVEVSARLPRSLTEAQLQRVLRELAVLQVSRPELLAGPLREQLLRLNALP